MDNDTAVGHVPPKLEDATEWYLTLSDPEVSDKVLNDWQTWLALSVSNREAFSEVQEIMRLSSRVVSAPWPDENELLDDCYRGDVSVENWCSEQAGGCQTLPPQARMQQHRSLATTRLWRFAAIALVSVGAGFVWWAGFPAPQSDSALAVHETVAAEHRQIELSDGSVISLGARTLISVAYTDEYRRVLLERGEAYFEVAKDKRRPFEVRAGNRIIKAVGTAFNVTRHSERVVVAVTEGEVVVEKKVTRRAIVDASSATVSPIHDVMPARLQAGQKFIYSPGRNEVVTTADPAAVTAWREGRLKFRNEPLRHVLEDVNRYSSRDIALGNDTIGDMRFTGTVFQDNIDGWLASVERAFALEARQTGDGGIVLLPGERRAIEKADTGRPNNERP